MRRWLCVLMIALCGCGMTPRTGATDPAKPARYQPLSRAPGPGPLFLIGGGETETSLLKRFMTVSGGPQAPLVVAPLANGAPEGERVASQFQALGAARVTVLTGQADADQAAVAGAYGIFFTGGLPEKLLAAYPSYQAAVTRAWKAGCAIGGTSAGAMVWGSRTIVSGESDQALRHGVDEAAGGMAVREGFGLLTETIVDPHFGERDRFQRLWVAAGATRMLGVGIDPRTAAAIGTDGTLTALGNGTVTLIRPDEGGAARVMVLKAGQDIALGDWRM